MILSIQKILFFAALFAVVGFCCSCGKADRNAKAIIAQAEVGRSQEDFDKLITEMKSNAKLSKPVRKSCQTLAVAIMQEKITEAWQANDENKLKALEQILQSDTVKTQINTDELLESVSTYCEDLQKKTRLQQLTELKKQLTGLKKQLQLCDVRKKKLSCEDMVMLERLYQEFNDPELEKYFSSLVAYGLVLTGRVMPETLPELKILQRKHVLTMCSRCRADGREPCHSCHGTGKCSMCNGTGQKRSYKLGYGRRFEECYEECESRCSLCKGDGFLTGRCRKCNGQKYLVRKSRLVGMYDEQHRLALMILQEMLKAVEEQQNSVSDSTKKMTLPEM